MSFDERGRCPRRYTGVVQCEDEVRIHARKMSENLFSNVFLLSGMRNLRIPLGYHSEFPSTPMKKIRTTDFPIDYADSFEYLNELSYRIKSSTPNLYHFDLLADSMRVQTRIYQANC